MQATRQHILKILKDREQATVDRIVEDLKTYRGAITSVTVRHHLARLQEDGLVASPQMNHRATPGRPRYLYSLTNKALGYFPNNYQYLAANLIQELERQLPPEQVNVIFEGIADNMATDVDIPEGSLADRIDAAVQYLNDHGYEARWESNKTGFILFTDNCPYNQIAHTNGKLCQLDMRLIALMLGVVPRRMSQISEGDDVCSYYIPDAELSSR